MTLLAPADIIQAFLIQAGLAQLPPATAQQWPVTVDSMPDQGNDNYITVYDTGADPDGRNFRTGDRVEHPTVQIRVRGKDDVTAKARAQLLAARLLKVGGQAGVNGMLGPVTVNVTDANANSTVQVTIVSARAEPLMPLRQEEKNKRRVYTMNVRFSLEG